ncbi:MAG TPA: lysylphosphatidylglycerol synthase transmembrane domain-containing protein [Candidatus Dormibacteraeota bacterium]|nr:lysylphosphatidylglycerol synthase transmembrane domain-containing protein [Candidatus Dormibacteraeota bacterium]
MLDRLTRACPKLLGSPWVRLAGTGLGVALFLHAVDLGEAGRLFSHVNPWWTMLAIGLAALSVISSVLEWGVLLRGTGHGLDWPFLGSWYLKGLFVSQVLPAGVGGDAMRALRIGRITGHGPMVASLIGSRMAGTLGMALWALAAAVLLRDILHVPVFAGFVAFAAFMLVAWVLALLAEGVRCRISERRRIIHRFARFLGPFTRTFESYRNRPQILAQSIAAGAVGWGLNLFSMQAFAIALGGNVSWSIFAVALPISLLATFVPISANGLGVREGVIFALLVHAHVSPGMATALCLFVDLQMIPFAVLGGLALLVEHRLPPRPARLMGRLDLVPIHVYPDAAGWRNRSRPTNE